MCRYVLVHLDLIFFFILIFFFLFTTYEPVLGLTILSAASSTALVKSSRVRYTLHTPLWTVPVSLYLL